MDVLLRDLREAAAAAFGMAMDRFRPGGAREDLIADVEEIARSCHVIGAAMLLIDGQPQELFLELSRAAENWRRLLRHLGARGLELPPASASAPLLGAVAAEDWPLAQQVAHLSSTAWREGEEYQEDCDWAVLLRQVVLDPGDRAAAAPLVERLQASAGDACADRIALLDALWDGNAGRFVEAFRSVAATHAEETEEIAAVSGLPVIEFAPYRFLWLEGLALLRLAARAGLDTRRERFSHCPPLARVARTAIYPGDGAIAAGV